MRSNPSHTPTHTHFTLLQPRFRCAIRRQCGCRRAKTFLDRDWKRKRAIPSLALFLSFSFTSWHFLLPPFQKVLNQFVCPDNRSGFGMISRDHAQVKLSTFKGTNVHVFSSPTNLTSEGITSNLLSAHTDNIRTRSTTWYEWNLALRQCVTLYPRHSHWTSLVQTQPLESCYLSFFYIWMSHKGTLFNNSMLL